MSRWTGTDARSLRRCGTAAGRRRAVRGHDETPRRQASRAAGQEHAARCRDRGEFGDGGNPRSPKRAMIDQEESAHSEHKQRIFKATGTTEDDRQLRFLIYQRQSLRDDPSYSCGILYLPPSGPNLTLARYNGPNHQHGDIRYKPHIHRATEAAIIAGIRPKHEAEETTRYETLEGAMACLIEDFRLSGIRATPDQPSLFNVYQS